MLPDTKFKTINGLQQLRGTYSYYSRTTAESSGHHRERYSKQAEPHIAYTKRMGTGRLFVTSWGHVSYVLNGLGVSTKQARRELRKASQLAGSFAYRSSRACSHFSPRYGRKGRNVVAARNH